jgi:hypothetical protein
MLHCSKQVIAVRAPEGSTLTIPDPHRGAHAVANKEPQFEAIIQSKDGPLAIYALQGDNISKEVVSGSLRNGNGPEPPAQVQLQGSSRC